MAVALRRADATIFARLGGHSLILHGRIGEGMALLDEVMVSVTADEVAQLKQFGLVGARSRGGQSTGGGRPGGCRAIHR